VIPSLASPDLALLAALALGLLALSARHGSRDSTAHLGQPVEAAIPMRDGKTLAADLYLPKRPGAYPALLIQTPYSRKQVGAALPNAGKAGPLVDPEQYALVVVDWRGFHGSKPAGEGARFHPRGQDGYDTVEWIARQPWSNGKVGSWGPSALGRIQFLTAREQPPHLVCCVPIVASPAVTYADYYDNGVFREAHVKLLDRLGFGVLRMARAAPSSAAPLYRVAAKALQPERINVPMLLITGWYDPGVATQMRAFKVLRAQAGEATRRHTKMLVGPWHHTAIGQARQGALEFPGAVGESERVARLFLDYWLRGERHNGWDELAAFRWWQMGEEGWHDAADPGAVVTTDWLLTLHGDGRLDERPAGAAEPARAYTADPANPVPTRGGTNIGYGTAGGMGIGPLDQSALEGRPDVLVYTTPPVEKARRLFGSAVLQFRFTIDRPDATFAVRLCDVHPDGRSLLICDGATRVRYRDGSGRPSHVVPGDMYTAALTLPPMAVTLPPGHRLRISIAGSNHPRFELNPHTGADPFDRATAVPARCTLFHDAARPATLRVPLLP
jgi:predicted acyl esterase